MQLDAKAIAKTIFPPRSPSPTKKRKAGEEEGSKAAQEQKDVEQRGRKRRKTWYGGDDGTKGLEGNLELAADAHSGSTSSGLSQSIGISPSPSTPQEDSEPASQTKPLPPLIPFINRRQGGSKEDSYRTKDDKNTTIITEQDPCFQILYADESKYDRLRREELVRRRPRHNPDLFHCDYDRHLKTVVAALKGVGAWDEYELCEECLGGEYRS